MTDLPPKQQLAFDFIKSKPVPPTIRELMDGTGNKSTSDIYKILKELDSAGVIIWNRGISRGITVPGTDLPAIDKDTANLLTRQDAEINRLTELVEMLKQDLLRATNTIESQRAINEMLKRRITTKKGA